MIRIVLTESTDAKNARLADLSRKATSAIERIMSGSCTPAHALLAGIEAGTFTRTEAEDRYFLMVPRGKVRSLEDAAEFERAAEARACP